MKTFAQLTIAVAMVTLAAPSAGAESYAKRPIRVLVASAPSGPSDVQIRLLVPKMTEVLGQSLIVDNRASNNGVVASEITAKATPDGYTIQVGNSGTHAINAGLYKHLAYDPVRDFAPISQFSTTGLVVAANPKMPGHGFGDLVEAAKKTPGKLNVGIAGATGQLAGDALWSMLGLKLSDVGYKGSSPTELAVLGGEVNLALLTPLAVASHLAVGRMKAYGITSARRSPLLPDVPTLAEQGVQGYEFEYWNGLFAPARTPPKILRELHDAVLAALHTPEVKERFTQLGLTIVGNTPEEFAAVVKREAQKYRMLIVQLEIPRL